MGLKACCYCIDLRGGALISAYLVLVYTLGMSVYDLTSFFEQIYLHHPPPTLFILNIFYGVDLLTLLIMTIVGFLQLLTTIILLVGVHKDKPKQLLATILLSAIFVAVEGSVSLWIIFMYGTRFPIFQWTLILIHKIWLIFYVYLLVVFGSYWKKISEGGDSNGCYA